MNKITVDANVLKDYYEEIVAGCECCLTKSPAEIFEDTSLSHILMLDEGGHIQQEWSDPIDPNWFKEWFYERLISGHAEIIPTPNHGTTCTSLYTLGFPRRSRDIWYVRVAKTCAIQFGTSNIVTEDIDFFDPRKKNSVRGSARIDLLKSRNALVKKHLRRNESIEVLCVYDYL